MAKWLRILLTAGLGLIGGGEPMAQTAGITCAEAARTLIEGASLDADDGKARALTSSEINWSTIEGHKGACLLDGQGRVYLVKVTKFPEPAMAEYNLICSSQRYQRMVCPMQGPGTARIVRQISQIKCIDNGNWGVDGSTLWVDKGCAAQFAIKPTWTAYSQNCESRNGRRETCRLKGPAEVSLIRQLGSETCRRDWSWGVNQDTMWVDKNCRGQFRVNPVGQSIVNNRTLALRACTNEASRNRLDIISEQVIMEGPRYIDVRMLANSMGINMNMTCRYDNHTREARLSGS